jgi:hypothetical protein
MKNKKEELFNGYSEANEQLKQMQQEQHLLFGVCGFLLIWVCL